MSNGNFIRKHKNSNFTIVDNNILKNKDISLKAKGLLILLLSLPENWEFSENGLIQLSLDGKSGVRSGLVELENNNYLYREQFRNDKGHYGGSIYHIYESPRVDYPKADYPIAEKPITVNVPNKELNNKVLNDKELKDVNPIVPLEKERRFNEFWEVYPKKVDKKRARRYYDKLSEETHLEVMEDVKSRSNSRDWTKEKGKYIPMPSTYLNNERWKDTVEVGKPTHRKRKVL